MGRSASEITDDSHASTWMTFFTMPVGRVAVVALLLALASGERAYGQSELDQRESLRGGGQFYVVIDGIDEAERNIGLSEEGLRALPLNLYKVNSVYIRFKNPALVKLVVVYLHS